MKTIVVRAFNTLEKWAKNAKKLLEKVRDNSKTDVGLAIAAKCLIRDWKGTGVDMRKRGTINLLEERPVSKKIHVAWPVLCKIELEDAMNKFCAILGRVNYRDDKDILVLAMKSVISAGEKALEELEKAYGK